MKQYNLIGQQFTKLIVLELMPHDPTTPSNRKKKRWKCECTCKDDERNIVIATTDALRRQEVRSCGCLQAESAKERAAYRKANGIQVKTKHSPRTGTAKRVYHGAYSDGDLEFEEFERLSQMNCFYCNAEPNNRAKAFNKNSSQFYIDNCEFIYSGLDRLNPKLGHLKSNVVPCCFQCNAAKSDMSFEEFIAWLLRLKTHSLSSKLPPTPPPPTTSAH